MEPGKAFAADVALYYNNYIMALKDETPILIKPKKEDDTNKK